MIFMVFVREAGYIGAAIREIYTKDNLCVIWVFFN